MRRQISMVADVSSNQAWWLLCLVLPKGTDATRAMERASLTGADYGERYHVTYARQRQSYTVILDLREE